MSSHPRHSIQFSLLSKNLIFTFFILLVGTVLVIAISTLVLTQFYVARMAANTIHTTSQIIQFEAGLEDELVRYLNDDAMVGSDKTVAARALSRLYRTAQHFQRVLLVDDLETIIYAYPPEELKTTLSAEEDSAISRAIASGKKQRVISQIDGNGQMISLFVPVRQPDSENQTVLIGRFPAVDLTRILSSEDGDKFSTYLINTENRVLLQTGGGASISTWPDNTINTIRSLNVSQGVGGSAFFRQTAGQAWDLVYFGPPTSQGWNIAMVLPFNKILNQSILYGFGFAVFIMILGTVFVTHLHQYSRRLSGPIKSLTRESHAIADGGILTNRIYSNRQDEVGDLTHAFTKMQLALKGRLDELSLLLDVTQDISSSINIKQSMPIILQGALRGTGASGARVLILDPTGRVPIPFTEGPSGLDMAVFDHSMMKLLREHKELALGSVQQISDFTGLNQADIPPIKALFALPLYIKNLFRGVIFLGYRQTRAFTASERQLLRTLSGQAKVLVENAYLYSNAEGGRRRLEAVLASTSEAIIVTDQTNRIFVINKAMEDAFKIASRQVSGRKIEDVIASEELVDALKASKAGKLDIEIQGENDRSYFVNISPIVNLTGLVIGKVAILTDVTHYKEIDRLKSDFVSNVSHDLRTPLTLMHGYISALISSGNLTENQLDYLAKITHSTDHMTSMVETLLNMSRIDAGVDLLFEQVDIMLLLNEVVVEHLYYSQTAGLVLIVEDNPNLPLVIAERSLIIQAISNFLTNCYKYAPRSGEVVLAAQQVGSEIVISVRDNGPGIARQDQIRLFEKFYRGQRDGSDDIEGWGMGLGLVKTIADRHNGRAWVESELGQGSTFYFSIPLNGIEVSKFEA